MPRYSRFDKLMSGSFLEDKAFLRSHKALISTSAKFAAQNPDLLRVVGTNNHKVCKKQFS